MSERTLVRDLQKGDELIGDIIYEGKVLLKKGTVLTALQVERLHTRFRNLDITVDANKYEQPASDTSTVSSISGYCQQKTVDIIHLMYDKIPEDWKYELSEIKQCMTHIVTNVKSSESLCYDLQDFNAEDKKERRLYRVAKIVIALANAYNNTVAQSEQINLTNIGMAALFYDYGKRFKNEGEEISKLKIDNSLFRALNLHPQFFKKPYDESFHSVYAYASLKSTISEEVCKIVLLSGLHNSIVNKLDHKSIDAKAAKAIALCYKYDELLEQVIRDNLSTPLENVLSVIDQGVKNGSYSRNAYKLFMDNILIYAPGTKVILTSGEHATVVGNNKSFPSRPLVFTDNTKGRPRLVDLSETINITVKEILIENNQINRKVNMIETEQLRKIVAKDN